MQCVAEHIQKMCTRGRVVTVLGPSKLQVEVISVVAMFQCFLWGGDMEAQWAFPCKSASDATTHTSGQTLTNNRANASGRRKLLNAK